MKKLVRLEQNNEIELNIFRLVVGFPELTYERILPNRNVLNEILAPFLTSLKQLSELVEI